MKYITSIFGYTFGILFLLIIIPLLLLESIFSKSRPFTPLIRAIARLIPRLFFIKIDVSGLENIPKDRAVLFMGNHVNLFDGIILYGYTPGRLTGIELEKHFHYPVWGFVIKRLGVIPMSHSNVRAAMESLKFAKQKIEEGYSIGMMPEGHRTRDGKLAPFMRGVFRLALESQGDIIPFVFRNARERKRYGSFWVTPGKMSLEYGKAIEYNNVKEMKDKELRDLVREKIETMLK